MAELVINKTIKIILGVFVLVVVIIALYMVFKNSVMDFFENLFSSEPTQLFLSVLK